MKLLGLFAFAFLSLLGCQSEATISKTMQVNSDDGILRANFIKPFVKFITVPAPPYKIALMGGAASSLKTLEDMRKESRIDFTVHTPKENEDLSRFSVVVYGKEKADLSKFAQKSVVTVGESPDFLERGGIIQLVPLGERMKFCVNFAALDLEKREKSNLWFGARFLILAANKKNEKCDVKKIVADFQNAATGGGGGAAGGSGVGNSSDPDGAKKVEDSGGSESVSSGSQDEDEAYKSLSEL